MWNICRQGFYYELSERNEVVTRKHAFRSMITLRKNLEKNMRKARMKAGNEKNLVLCERSEQDLLTRMANRFRLGIYGRSVFAYSGANDIPLR